jgi:dipeptidyl aminopeptidase/acylaminoacyl peptidase
MAQPFDPERLRLRGDPFPVAEPVGQSSVFLASALFSASDSGALAYAEGAAIAATELVWVDREGRRLATVGEPADYSNPALSPDGSRLAVGRRDPQTRVRDIWLFDLKRGSSSRLTFDAADDLNPAWSPDGRRIAFSSARKGSRDLYWRSSDGTGDDELLLASGEDKNVEDWSLDGKWLLFNQRSQDTGVLRLEPERKPTPVLSRQFTEIEARLSPNGRWIAYRSNESGRPEVYVQSFPPGSGKWQVSTAGGVEPSWRRDGKELFYLAGTKLMAVETKTEGSSFEAGLPKALLEAPRLGPSGRNRYVAAPDGRRFLFVSSLEATSSRPFVVVLNWDAGRTRR